MSGHGVTPCMGMSEPVTCMDDEKVSIDRYHKISSKPILLMHSAIFSKYIGSDHPNQAHNIVLS